MSALFSALQNTQPSLIALESAAGSLTYGELVNKIEHVAHWLQQQKIESLSIYAENSIDWVITDLACQYLGIVFTPIPLFFSKQQVNNLITSAKPTLILSDQVLPFNQSDQVDGLSLTSYQLSQPNTLLIPNETSKITFTSGSTGTPKGVCLSVDNQLNIAKALVNDIALANPRHLCLLPLATLLENIAGVYSPLLAKGTVIVANDAERGFQGSRLLEPATLLTLITTSQPNSLILVPELLQVLIHAVEQGWSVPTSLKFIAVGGSKVASAMINKARDLKLPVYQGYGLSENSSVVSLCTPAHDNIKSAGRILPNLHATIENGELVVEGNCFLGYLDDESSWYNKRIYTGDLAEIKQGFLYITGRVKNILVNSYGRNISPEWVEAEILATGLFQQAVLIGDSKPFCIAILTPFSSNISEQRIDQALYMINQTLPDYAQIKGRLILTQPMTYQQGLYTANGRPKRDVINQKFTTEIDRFYLNELSA